MFKNFPFFFSSIFTNTMKILILYFSLLVLFSILTVIFFAGIELDINGKEFQKASSNSSGFQIIIEPTEDFKCPPDAATYHSNYSIRASFLDQAGQILSYGGTLFN